MKFCNFFTLFILINIFNILNINAQGIQTFQAIRSFHPDSPNEYVTILPPNNITSYGLTLPAVQGNAGQVLINDGTGILSWGTIGGGAFWNLQGNAGTTDGTDFIGTTDNIPLTFRVHNITAGRIESSGKTLFGFQAGESSTASNLTAFGYGAAQSTSGTATTAFGNKALFSNTSGENNSAFGFESMMNNTSGFGNIALGKQSLFSNIDGKGNISIGNEALFSNISGHDNLALGTKALYNNIANNNSALGIEALKNNITGDSNVATGNQALFNNTTGQSNIATGNQTLFNNIDGGANTAIGHAALYNNISGSQNLGLGTVSLYSNSTGIGNSALGSAALYNNTSGEINIGVGYTSLYGNTTGSSNIGIGYAAFHNNTTGSRNIVIGKEAALTYNNVANEIGDNIFIGNNTAQGIETGLKNTIIGSNITGLASNLSNHIILADGDGNQRINVDENGNVGIGTTTPLHKLDIDANPNNAGNPLRLKGLLEGSLTDSILTSENGVVRRLSIAQIASGTGSAWTLDGNTEGAIKNLGTLDNYDLPFVTNNIERMRLTTNGELGIGTSTPSGILDVVGQNSTINILANHPASFGGAVGASVTIRAAMSGNGNGTGGNVTIAAGAAGGGGGTGGNVIIASGLNNGGTGGHIIFKYNDYGSFGAGTEAMRVASNGYVGIGSTSPSYKLSLAGTASLADRTMAINNTPVVYLPDQTTFPNNLAFGNGLRSLNNTFGGAYDNTAIGINALLANTQGTSNVAVGTNALKANTSASSNTAIGQNALQTNTTGFENTAIGNAAMNFNTTGRENVAIGVTALNNNTTGIDNTACGKNALYSNTTGNYNTGLGYQSLRANTTGSSNLAAGFYSLYNNTTGSDNVALGYSAAQGNTTGINNVAIGVAAIMANTTGSQNIAIGNSAGRDYNNTANETANNIFIGYGTGRGITTGTNNTIIGANVTGLTSTLSNNIILADGAGNRRINVDASGNTGIGTTTPNTKLDVNGAFAIRPSATSITADNQAVTVGNQSFLKLNSNGTPSNRTITLSNGLQEGQQLVIHVIATGINGIELEDTSNLDISGNAQLDSNDTITLIWSSSLWIEMYRSSN